VRPCGGVVVGVNRRVRYRGDEELCSYQKIGDIEEGMVARSEGSRWPDD
jgi:hypothetical protein